MTAALTVVLAAPAYGATARVENGRILYVAAAGERNQLTTAESPGTLVLRDAGAPITAGDGCTAVEGGVSCSVPSTSGLPPVLDAYLGDGDDTYKGTSRFDNVRGGSGNDRLRGEGRLWGGAGNDVVESTFYIHDDDGKVAAKDVYRGGGQTVLTYENRRTPVRVDLRGGRSSEDRISGVRMVRGTPSNDVLIGDNRTNDLVGGGGHDRIEGLGGDDRISSSGGTADIDCGAGRDTVSTGRSSSAVARCEIVNGARLTSSLRTPGATFLTAAVPTEAWVAKARGRTVAKGGKTPLRLNAAGRRLLKREGALTVRVTRSVSARPLNAFAVELRLR